MIDASAVESPDHTLVDRMMSELGFSCEPGGPPGHSRWKYTLRDTETRVEASMTADLEDGAIIAPSDLVRAVAARFFSLGAQAHAEAGRRWLGMTGVS